MGLGFNMAAHQKGSGTGRKKARSVAGSTSADAKASAPSPARRRQSSAATDETVDAVKKTRSSGVVTASMWRDAAWGPGGWSDAAQVSTRAASG